MPYRPPPLSVAEIADDTGIPRRTIQHAIATGKLKAYKLPGGRHGIWVIERTDLTDWLHRRRIEALRTAHPKASA